MKSQDHAPIPVCPQGDEISSPSSGNRSFSVAVLVPTYRRPEHLRRCLCSLVKQTMRPREIIVVVRDTDGESRDVVREFQARICSPTLTMVPVTAPGPLPAIERGFDALRARSEIDLVLVIDDDAQADPRWIETISRHFNDPTVGAVAGRVVTWIEGRLLDLPPAQVVGRISWYGRHTGNMYRPVAFTTVREVESFVGANVALRRTVLDELVVDRRVRGSAIAYEVDLALQIIEKHYRVLFDPQACVHHFEAPRPPDVESREDVPRKISTYSHNHTYVMMKHLPLIRRLAFLVYFFLIGERGSWGILTALAETLLKRQVSHWPHVLLAYGGKIAGVKSYLDFRRERRRSVAQSTRHVLLRRDEPHGGGLEGEAHS